MLYYSLNGDPEKVTFKEAVLRGLAPDNGLYFPETIPVHDAEFINNLAGYSTEEIGYRVISPFTGDCITKEGLREIITGTLTFDFPLVPVEKSIFSLELFHGPTLAFKDVGARFLSRCLGYFGKDAKRNTTVLVATSGDTGGAVADGFYDVEGVNVIILYPSGKVSKIQELQLTTLGKNIVALEIEGNFDDCQRLVKAAFLDKDVLAKRTLTSANSINVARWLSQQIYYFLAYKQWPPEEKAPVISVPSGNFGNICAGLMAFRTGLPVRHFIAACNANEVFVNYLRSNEFRPAPSVATLSNAMDVGNPSNFMRVLELFVKEHSLLSDTVSGYSVSDDQTVKTMKTVFDASNYILDPHGAVGYFALYKYLQEHGGSGIFLETAHPVKFFEQVESIIQQKIAIPAEVEALLGKKKNSVKMKADFASLKEYLLVS